MIPAGTYTGAAFAMRVSDWHSYPTGSYTVVGVGESVLDGSVDIEIQGHAILDSPADMLITFPLATGTAEIISVTPGGNFRTDLDVESYFIDEGTGASELSDTVSGNFEACHCDALEGFALPVPTPPDGEDEPPPTP